MPLVAGNRLGPYEVIAPLGAGGMGEVYKARDTRLERIVAIKVLPQHLSASPEVRQRFEREAKTISQLSHPHICALYDVGHQNGIEYLVMEFLEGGTLSDRLAKGALPLEQTLRFGIEIADALDKAHRQGIVHRDLKPGNVMLTKSGVKLLDFGLAKAIAPGASQGSLTALPTQSNLTAEGAILGTFQYMAPEQLEGKQADARTDIFAFGAVLYEMATGRKAFAGKSPASLISSIMTSEPTPISALQPMTPPALDRVVKICCAKDPEDRWQNAHDVAAELKWIAEGGSQAGLPAPVVAKRRSRERLAWALASLLGLFLLATFPLALRQLGRGRAPGRALKFSILPPQGVTFQPGMMALSPDGGRLAFAATGADGKSLLWIRPLESVESRPLSGTDGGFFPFWSPDGRFLAFFAEGKLKKIEASGGPPQTLCDARVGRGGTWNREGIIVFAPFPTGNLYRVSSAGGQATPVTTLDESRQENSHRWPAFLPDGRHFLFFARSKQRENRAICVGSLDSRRVVRLMSGNSNALYTPPGYLLFERDGWLVARRLDPRRLELEGDPLPIAEKVRGSDPLTAAAFTVSETGFLAYGTGAAADSRQLVWLDRSGKPLGSIGSPAIYIDVSLSPDQKRVALDLVDMDVGGREMWLIELNRGVTSRLSLGPRQETSPIWSPNGSRIAFASSERGFSLDSSDLYQRPSSGAGDEELLFKSDALKVPSDWSLDGRLLLYETIGPRTKRDLWVLPLSGDRKPTPVLQMPFNESFGSFSPDGRWIVYVSDESGRPEVYVQAFPISTGKWQISKDGGSQPRWRRDGKEIFYLAPDSRLMAVAVTAGSTFEADSPKPLFEAGVAPTGVSNERHQYCVTSDGQRFLLTRPVERRTAQPITVVLNWTADLKK